eukprot:400525_1
MQHICQKCRDVDRLDLDKQSNALSYEFLNTSANDTQYIHRMSVEWFECTWNGLGSTSHKEISLMSISKASLFVLCVLKCDCIQMNMINNITCILFISNSIDITSLEFALQRFMTTVVSYLSWSLLEFSVGFGMAFLPGYVHCWRRSPSTFDMSPVGHSNIL